MEPDEKHEPQYERDGSMDMVEFEEQNTDWLIEKFMKIKEVMKLWEQFVSDEYDEAVRSQEPLDYREDR